MTKNNRTGNKKDIFVNRLSRIFKLEKKVIEKMVTVKPLQSLRSTVKTDETTITGIKSSGCEIIPLPWAKGAFAIQNGYNSPVLHEKMSFGECYIQNASSYIPVIELDPQNGDKILDLCSAPGGKASYIAYLSNNKSELTINDADQKRLQNEITLLTSQGVKIAKTICMSAEKLDPKELGLFDKILLDAQCSNESAIIFPIAENLSYWSINKIEELSGKQRQMIRNAFKLLKPGGRLVYSTCTYAPEENERVINTLLKENENAIIEDISLELPCMTKGLTEWNNEKYHPSLEKCVRIMPDPLFKGFFVAVIEKHIESGNN